MNISYSSNNIVSEDLADDELRSELVRLVGLFVGQLDNREAALFEAGVTAGMAYRKYDGVAGLMGMPLVALRSEPGDLDRSDHEECERRLADWGMER